jgi:hypothetical protein
LGIQFAEVRRLLKETLGGQALDSFQKALEALRDAIGSRDAKAALERHLALQSEFLSILDHFEFRNPPVLLMAGNYVRIAGEALEKGRLGKVSHDMGVIIDTMPRLRVALNSKGLAKGQVDEVEATARAVRRSADARKREEARVGLDALGRLLAEATGTQGGADSLDKRER